MRLGIFLVVLWGLSETFPMTSFGMSFNIPGYLIWLAVLYAADRLRLQVHPAIRVNQSHLLYT